MPADLPSLLSLESLPSFSGSAALYNAPMREPWSRRQSHK